MRKQRESQRGQATVEAAFSFLVFLPVLFGIIEFGRLIYTYNFVHYMARDATRWASVRGSSAPTAATASSIETFVRDQAVVMTPGDLTVTTTWEDGSNAPGKAVQVFVSYPVPGIVRWVLPSVTTVASSSSMIILQ